MASDRAGWEQLKDDAAALEWLRDPRCSLPVCGYVMHQRTDAEVLYDPREITGELQGTILSYLGDPPRRAGQTTWLAVLKYRQAGASTTAQIGVYPKAAYTPGWDHLTLADKKDRAEYLHNRVNFLHQRWPEQIRTPTLTSREVRQLTFDPLIGGKMRVASLETESVGIGQSANSVLWSEVGFCGAAASQWTLMQPAMVNKDNVLFVQECTPTTADEPGTEFWRETCYDAKKGSGRLIYAFFPYWDGHLNRRPWPDGAALDSEEIRLIERYGPHGLTIENLAFRRAVLEGDREIRRNPALFDVFYPKDDTSCWVGAVRGVIPSHVLERHRNGVLVPWPYKDEGGEMEYAPPRPGAMYVIGVDPTGYGTRDHAALQVLEVWDGCWRQVATYSAPVGDPNGFERVVFRLGMRYNRALVVVESTGVGTSVLALLIEHEYPNVYFEARGKPGKSATGQSVEKLLGYTTDALLDDLELHDEDLVDQLGTYKNDKLLEETARAEALRGTRPLRSRRPRHHWDKVSALTYAVFGARLLPQRRDPARPPEVEVLPARRTFDDMTWNEQQQFHRLVAQDNAPKHRGVRYVGMRRR